MVRALGFHCPNLGSVFAWGTEILQACSKTNQINNPKPTNQTKKAPERGDSGGELYVYTKLQVKLRTFLEV